MVNPGTGWRCGAQLSAPQEFVYLTTISNSVLRVIVCSTCFATDDEFIVHCVRAALAKCRGLRVCCCCVWSGLDKCGALAVSPAACAVRSLHLAGTTR